MKTINKIAKHLLRDKFFVFRNIIFKVVNSIINQKSGYVLTDFSNVNDLINEEIDFILSFNKKLEVNRSNIILSRLSHFEIFEFLFFLKENGFSVFNQKGSKLSKHQFMSCVEACYISRRYYSTKGFLIYDYSDIKIHFKSISYKNKSDICEPEVDIVYTWVDGEDESWKIKKNNVLLDKLDVLPTSNIDSRYKSRDELKYSIRSIFLYAPWVRNIYIVTDEQIPSWFIESERIKIIDHKEIFPDLNVLPVFNSHAIESCLHRIPGLSDFFLYLNDDVMLTRPCDKTDFFDFKNKKTKFFLSTTTFVPETLTNTSLPVDISAYNNLKLLHENYNYTSNRKFQHTPIALSKSVLLKLELEHPDVFNTCRKNKIRSIDDYSIVSSLHHHYGIIIKRSIESKIRYDYINLADKSAKHKLLYLLLCGYKRRPKVICINDVDERFNQSDDIDIFLEKTLSNMYPYASECERLLA
ncbi:stealth conserved region 3 domain-containing protein [Grimontia hollisae]|uniref:Capsular polysaccharide phosphotransferase SacB n=2 Tax=Grimontia hollisae TaxID=673 RepID=A0A377HMB5_GRIHO|nr:stealth conserved region 3 domain-containing protein [Grimontia hollisae]STO56885.1 Capsular polysaccharide phosphotransferase SacB [Grimontia hollisae]STQ74740.1 Capsular polysaccharide phosphotransferase SacB [Grimontia hollisae]